MRSLMKVLILGVGFLLPFAGNAQQVVASAGSHGTGTNVQLSWTVGETVIETFTGSSAILTQGFHQSKLLVTALDPLLLPGLTLTVYPNPVSETLLLDFQGEIPQGISYHLYDIGGKVIRSGVVNQFPGKIGMEQCTPGTYLLKVLKNEQTPLKTFRIVKN